MLAAGLILAVMVIPFTSSVAREVLKSVPAAQREGAYALGATRFEAIRAALFYARTGIVGAIMLGFGRALGETMAVTMVIGNNPRISASLFAPQYTMAAVLANEFTEADTELYLNALIEIGLVLFVITLHRELAVAPADLEHGEEPVGCARRAGHAADCCGGGMSSKSTRLAQGRCRRCLSASARCRCWWRSFRSPSSCSSSCSEGISAVNLDFFTKMPKPVGETGGGMANAIVGTLILTGLGSAFAVPIGVLSGVYMSEYAGTRFASLVRFAADTLNGVPSIVIGVFVYGIAVLPFKQFSAFAGGLALGVMMIPIIARTTEELLLLVPGTMREGALALGATRSRAVFTVVLPSALPGIITGIVLALARIAGETAPLLFTAFNNRFFTTSLTQPIASLTVQVFTYAISPYKDWHRQAWAGALVLVTIVFLCSLLARFATRRLESIQSM